MKALRRARASSTFTSEAPIWTEPMMATDALSFSPFAFRPDRVRSSS
jgi:hypothetical protein